MKNLLEEQKAMRRRLTADRRREVATPQVARVLIAEAAQEWGILTSQVTSHNNSRPCVCARTQVARRLYTYGYSLPQIGNWLGGFDHTTVLYWLKRKNPNKPYPSQSAIIPVPDLSGEWAI